jgi:hypothetical protein
VGEGFLEIEMPAGIHFHIVPFRGFQFTAAAFNPDSVGGFVQGSAVSPIFLPLMVVSKGALAT